MAESKGEPAASSFVDLALGSGAGVAAGDTVSVHFTARILDGAEIDSSRGGAPLTFTVGQGDVIAGWEQGVAGMRVGGRRRLTLPPALAYGERGVPGKVPRGATLVFEIELVALRRALRRD